MTPEDEPTTPKPIEPEATETTDPNEVEAPEPEQPAMPPAVCGLAVFVKPNGAGLMIHQMRPEQEPVERIATPSDIRGIVIELSQQLQAEMTVGFMERRAMQAQERAMNDQIAAAALGKGNGNRAQRRGMGIVQGRG